MSTKGQVIKCLAAVAWGPNLPLSIEEIEVQPPKAGEVRIKILYTGVCHTDAFSLGGRDTHCKFPIILGHEGAGIVESVGEGVTRVKEGDQVLPSFMPRCDDCKFCKSNKTNLCVKTRGLENNGVMLDGTSRFSCKGRIVHHYLDVSSFSQYTVVSDLCVTKIRDDAPLEKVCLFSCGVSTGYGAALNTAKVEPGSVCAVFGLGTIGLAAVMGCAKKGASRIIGIDINSSKFEVGKQFGITEFINPNDYKQPIQEIIAERTDGGCDYTFACVGDVSVMKSAFESCVKGWGECITIGVAGAHEVIDTNPMQLIFGKVLKGTCFGGWKLNEVPKLVDDYMNKKLMLDEFITHKCSLERINEAFDLLHAGNSLRTVVDLV